MNTTAANASIMRYEHLKNMQKQIEDELESLAPEILAYMEERGAEETPMLNGGKIVIAKKTKWKYGNEIREMEEAVEEKKSICKANGLAEKEETRYLKYVRES